ncbi:MAG: hypothetical protein KH138_03615 [Firmicutes bacterium]|nr:hypothetical protein [Bacillota bacterium]
MGDMRTGFVKPEHLMDFFDENRQALASDWAVVARDRVKSREIYLASDSGTPCFQVIREGIILSEVVKSRAEAQVYYEGALKLLGFIKEDKDDSTLLNVEDSTEEPDECEDDATNGFLTPEQDDRMVEVYCAAEDFLKVLLSGKLEDYDLMDADLEELCVEVGKSLYKKYGISINFPMEVMDADGNLYVEDYPFEESEEESYD